MRKNKIRLLFIDDRTGSTGRKSKQTPHCFIILHFESINKPLGLSLTTQVSIHRVSITSVALIYSFIYF